MKVKVGSVASRGNSQMMDPRREGKNLACSGTTRRREDWSLMGDGAVGGVLRGQVSALCHRGEEFGLHSQCSQRSLENFKQNRLQDNDSQPRVTPTPTPTPGYLVMSKGG